MTLVRLIGLGIFATAFAFSAVPSTAAVEVTAVRAALMVEARESGTVRVTGRTPGDPAEFGTTPSIGLARTTTAIDELPGSASVPLTTQASPDHRDPVAVVAVLRAAAREFGTDEQRLISVGFCESSLRDVPRVGQAQEVGWFQWLPRTWEWLAARSALGYDIRHIGDLQAQARLTAWAFANGYAELWTCAR